MRSEIPMEPEAIPVEEKRRALDSLLASRALSRSERLRAFLRYVCEAEFEGRAQEINEYALGVSVLGRPAEYSPGEDSSVRSRAYELRGKLRTYYASEGAQDRVRIEIDKGAYVPRFIRTEQVASTPPAVPEVAASAPPAAPETATRAVVSSESLPSTRLPAPARTAQRRGVLAAVAAVLLLAGAAVIARSRDPKPVANTLSGPLATPEMEALWRPFLDSRVPVLVSFETRLFYYSAAAGLVVRDYQANNPADDATSEALLRFEDRMDAHDLEQRLDYADFGAVHAAFLFGRLLAREVGFKHATSLGWQDIWNSNVIYLGKPTLNPAIQRTLEGRDFVGTETGSGIRNLHPHAGEPELYRNSETHGSGVKYGLVTVLPGPQEGRRMMILSGAAAELMWALAEAVTSPALVHEMMSRVVLPSGQYPPAFQVVVGATFESNVPVAIRYVTHRATSTLAAAPTTGD
jgi:hypothetical protein